MSYQNRAHRFPWTLHRAPWTVEMTEHGKEVIFGSLLDRLGVDPRRLSRAQADELYEALVGRAEYRWRHSAELIGATLAVAAMKTEEAGVPAAEAWSRFNDFHDFVRAESFDPSKDSPAAGDGKADTNADADDETDEPVTPARMISRPPRVTPADNEQSKGAFGTLAELLDGISIPAFNPAPAPAEDGQSEVANDIATH